MIFEGKVDLTAFLSQQKDYEVLSDGRVMYRNEEVGQIFKKHKFYNFLRQKGVDWKKNISSRLLPDDSIYIIINNTLHIVECKFQQVAGSVDEKL